MNHFYLKLLKKTSIGYARYRIITNEKGEADDLLILEVNRGYQTMMGTDEHENLVGRNVSDLDHLVPDKWPVESIKFYNKSAHANNNLTQSIEFTVPSSQKVYQIIVAPITEDEIICRYHDITEIKDDFLTMSMLEQDLKDQMALSSLFFTHSIASLFYMMIDEPIEWNDEVDKEAVLNYVFDHHRITRVNPAMEVQYRTRAENLIGTTSQDLFDNDITTCKKVWTDLFNLGRAQVYTEKQRLVGSKMVIKGDYISLYDNEGRITGLYGIQVDITAQKEAEDALIKSSEIYRFSQELGKVGGFEYHFKTGKIRWTEEMYRIHDINPEEVDHTINLMDVTLNCLRPFYRDKLEQELEALHSTRNRFDLEAPFTSAAGTPRWVRITVRPADQNAERLVGSMVEITQQKEIEMKLQKALEAAQSSMKSRTMFLASMSHEIRNPLNGIMGMLQLMETTPLNEEQRELMNLSQTSSESLLRIIDDVLDYSKIEAGAITLEKIPFNLRTTLQKVHLLFDKMAAKKEVEIILDIDDDVPERVKGDPHRFSQVLNNLMSNAVKFTKKGEIRISVAVDQVQQVPGDKEATLKISVQDTGMGIPEGKMDLLFQVFAQGDPSNTRLYGGTGLGLPIAKNIVEHMGGNIWVESTLGEGSTFTFTVQLKVIRKITIPAISSVSILF